MLAKIRGTRAFEIKRRLEEKGSLERWEVSLSEDFPLSAEAVDRIRQTFSADEFSLNDFERPSSALAALSSHADVHVVRKLRRLFERGDCKGEATRVIIDLRPFETVAIDCAEAGDASRTVRELGLDAYPNVNYGEMLRALSMTPARSRQPYPYMRGRASVSPGI